MDSLMIFMQIMLINLLLSGDNAIVIAMASQQLPKEQRKKAIWIGAGAAVALRCLMTVVAVAMLKIPYLQAVGAVLLFFIAVKLLVDAQSQSAGTAQHYKGNGKLSGAIQTIVIADLVMSLDNVLAIAAVAEGEPVLILLGIGLSIPMIIWGSQLLESMIRKLPILIYLGAGLLGYSAGKMLVHDPAIGIWMQGGHFPFADALPVLCIPLVMIVAILRRNRAF